MAANLRAAFKERQCKHYLILSQLLIILPRNLARKYLTWCPVLDILLVPKPSTDAVGLSRVPDARPSIGKDAYPKRGPRAPSWKEMIELLKQVPYFTKTKAPSISMGDFFPATKRVTDYTTAETVEVDTPNYSLDDEETTAGDLAREEGDIATVSPSGKGKRTGFGKPSEGYLKVLKAMLLNCGPIIRYKCLQNLEPTNDVFPDEFGDVFIFDACIGFYFYPLAEVANSAPMCECDDLRYVYLHDCRICPSRAWPRCIVLPTAQTLELPDELESKGGDFGRHFLELRSFSPSWSTRCAAIEEAVTSLRQSAHTEGGEEDLVIIFVRKVETHISKWGMVKTHRRDDKSESKRLLEREMVHGLGYESEIIIFMESDISAWFKREDWRKKEKGESSMLKNTLSIRDWTSHIVNGSGWQKSGTHTIEIRIHHAPPK
ncbi:hypothetical protein CK203_026558 [Vitis vinifera]|uniref:Uncharacterized protein n=1 Tax=Vitis vinifera TaxID=29760 RepID=A0A438IWL9_VITVI|nr:hypothetical protein CK203_026558 [Vitis vinifera]